ncbi:IS3 family transposase [Candidatus Mycoplasma pogonae]
MQSMSRKGNCLDNSIMENFFGILKREMLYGHKHEFEDIEDLIKAIENYIEYYNNQRISIRLNKMTPTEFRDHSNT